MGKQTRVQLEVKYCAREDYDMVDYCCVYNCFNNSTNEELSFLVLPAIKNSSR